MASTDGAQKTGTIAQEHAEPGTGQPPTPAYEDKEDKASANGWRRDTPPIAREA